MKSVIVLILWAVTIWRLPSARQEPWKRALWVAFAALAAALTFSLPGVARLLDELTGVTALATLLKHVAGILACAAVLEWVTALTRRAWVSPRWRFAGALAAATAMAVLFCFIPRGSGDFTDTMAGNPTATAYLMVFEAYLGLAMALATALFLFAARRAPRGLLGVGLWTLTTGSTVGVLYAFLRSTFLLICLGQGPHHSQALYTVTEHLQLVSITLILIGSSLPAISAILVASRDYQDLHALYTLWRRLTTSAPSIVLHTPPSRRGDLMTMTKLRLRLLRRIVEIRDAIILLRSYVRDEDIHWARSRLAAQGLSDERLEAATEAAWLRVAIHAHAAGRPPYPSNPRPQSEETGSPARADLASEVRWLRLIAAADRTRAVTDVAMSLTDRLTVEHP
jgi:hypothetical protein